MHPFIHSFIHSFRVIFVPVVVEECHVVAIRCVFNATEEAEVKKQLAARRRQMENLIMESSEVYLNQFQIALFHHIIK